MGNTKRKRGRPPKAGGAMRPLAIRFSDQMIDEIDAIIEGRMDRPDRAAIIRELIAEAIIARKKKGH